MPANDIYRCAINMILAGQQIQNVVHFKGITAAATADALASRLLVKFFFELRKGMSNECLFASVRVTTIAGNVGAESLKSFGANDKGALANVAMPPQVSGVIWLRTARFGRRGRGKIFIPAPPTTQVANGRLTSGQIINYESTASGLLGEWGASGSSADYRLGVFSRAIGGQVVPASASGWTQVTSIIVRGTYGTVRTRGIGRGN